MLTTAGQFRSQELRKVTRTRPCGKYFVYIATWLAVR